MSNLITDEMVETAHSVIDREIGAECPTPSECAACDAQQAATAILEAVAPLIAAAALRDAEDRLDDVRAEAMSRYSFGTYHGQMVQWHDAKKLAVDAFIAGAEWAVARARDKEGEMSALRDRIEKEEDDD